MVQVSHSCGNPRVVLDTGRPGKANSAQWWVPADRNRVSSTGNVIPLGDAVSYGAPDPFWPVFPLCTRSHDDNGYDTFYSNGVVHPYRDAINEGDLAQAHLDGLIIAGRGYGGASG